MRAFGYLAIPFILASTATAAQSEWNHAGRTEVTLSNFKFAPQSIHLQAGQPVVLHIVNTSSSRHNFAAKAFFGSATVRAADAALVSDGSVEVGGHQSVDIGLVPKAGQYPLKCTHTLHKMFGMSGVIVVS